MSEKTRAKVFPRRRNRRCSISGPSLTLLLLTLLVWLEFRPVEGRATLGFRRFFLYFLLGCIGSSLFTIILQRIAISFFDLKTVSWSFGPSIEELTKAAPLLLLIYYFKLGRRLTIADMTLIALACGLGFAFVETNFALLARGKGSFDFPSWRPSPEPRRKATRSTPPGTESGLPWWG